MSDIHPSVTIEDISSVKKKISFVVPWENVQGELDKAYQEAGKTLKIRGFRVGKVPRRIIEIHYREQIESETISNLVNEYYWNQLEEKQIKAITKPKIEQKGIQQNSDFTFSATVEVEPVIIPTDYLGLELEKEELNVTEDDIEKRIQEIQQMYATMEDLTEDRGTVLGDFLTIDFEGFLDGKKHEKLRSENYFLELGAGALVRGFEEQILGMKKDESKQITVSFPQDYHIKEFAGKEAEFTVKLKQIRAKVLPIVDETFVKNFEKYESLDDLLEDIRKSIESEKTLRIEEDLKKSIAEKLIERNYFEVPTSYVERQILYMMSDAQQRMVARGVDPSKANEFAIKMRDQFYAEAEKTVKMILLMKSIAEKESLLVSDEEIEMRAREMASQKSQDYDQYIQYLTKNNLVESIRSEIVIQKTYKYLEERAKITIVKKQDDQHLEGEE